MLDLNEIKRKVRAGEYPSLRTEQPPAQPSNKLDLNAIKQKVKNGEYNFGVDDNYIQS